MVKREKNYHLVLLLVFIIWCSNTLNGSTINNDNNTVFDEIKNVDASYDCFVAPAVPER